jgi:hypothetical protein
VAKKWLKNGGVKIKAKRRSVSMLKQRRTNIGIRNTGLASYMAKTRNARKTAKKAKSESRSAHGESGGGENVK